MPKRECLDCRRLIDASQSRCPTCQGTRDATRGTTTQRGYDAQHQTERAQWKPYVDEGGIACRRCGQPIKPGTSWDLGHPDAECPAPKAPEHARCNRGAPGRRRRRRPR